MDLVRLALWAARSPHLIAWPVALLFTAGFAVLGYRIYLDYPSGGMGVGISDPRPCFSYLAAGLIA